MNKTILTLAILAFSTLGFSQKSSWQEAKKFHQFMSASFHPAEDGNFKPLKDNCDSLAWAAEQWAKTPVPSNYKEKETKETLATLVKQSNGIKTAVKKNASDTELKKLITEAHDTFHKVVGECKKAEETK